MSCEETGILGAVTGVIGSMQALETIKIIGGLHGEWDITPENVWLTCTQDHKSVLLLFSALSTPPFRTVNLRKRQPTCPACSNPNHSIQTMDYIQFCGGPPTDWVENGQQQGQTNQRITPKVCFESWWSVKLAVNNDHTSVPKRIVGGHLKVFQNYRCALKIRILYLLYTKFNQLVSFWPFLLSADSETQMSHWGNCSAIQLHMLHYRTHIWFAVLAMIHKWQHNVWERPVVGLFKISKGGWLCGLKV